MTGKIESTDDKLSNDMDEAKRSPKYVKCLKNEYPIHGTAENAGTALGFTNVANCEFLFKLATKNCCWRFFLRQNFYQVKILVINFPGKKINFVQVNYLSAVTRIYNCTGNRCEVLIIIY